AGDRYFLGMPVPPVAGSNDTLYRPAISLLVYSPPVTAQTSSRPAWGSIGVKVMVSRSAGLPFTVTFPLTSYMLTRGAAAGPPHPARAARPAIKTERRVMGGSVLQKGRPPGLTSRRKRERGDRD